MEVDNSIKNKVIEEYELKKRVDFLKALGSINIDSIINQSAKSQFSTKYSKDDVKKYLENPQKFQREIRNMSLILSSISPQYNRLINYFPKLAVICPILIPNNSKVVKDLGKLEKLYENAISYLENMNIKHEFIKILTTIFAEDVFFGCEYETKQSYYIKKLNPDYCRISSIEDGCYNFQFNFAYFDRDKTGNLINNYPVDFKQKYNNYLKDKKQYQWQEISSDISICIKYNEHLDYVFPPFGNVFEDLYDISDYKSLQKAKTEIDNYKLIGLTIPIKDSDNVDDFKLDGSTVVEYYNNLLTALPSGVGAFISPMPFKELNFNKAISDKDNVNNAIKNYWDSAGVSSLLFGNGAVTGATLSLSLKTDEMLLYPVYRQLERWLNRKAKKKFKNFKVQILDITKFNQKEVVDNYMKASQFGLPVKLQLCAAMGLMPGDVIRLTTLENDLLKLHENWIPLSSSFTQSSDEAGREKLSDEDLSDEGERTRENGGNEEGNRV